MDVSSTHRLTLVRAGVLTPLVGTLVGLFGCDQPDPVLGNWTETRDSAAFQTVVAGPFTCEDCLRFEQPVVLGDTTGEGFLEYTEAFVRDSVGNYWLGQLSTGPKVFDADGSFLQEVGRRGQGPLEFQYSLPIHTDSAGRVHIFDLGNGRETTVGSDFQWFADRRIPAGILQAVPLGEGGRYAVNMSARTGGQIDLPLHIVNGLEILHSFGGLIDGDSEPLTDVNSQRVLASDGLGHVFSANFYTYEIEAWTEEGRRISGFRGPILNETAPSRGGYTYDNPLPNQIRDIRVDQAGRLWVLGSHRKPDWEDLVIEITRPDGTVGITPRDGSWSSIMMSRIDVIDMNSLSIIASTEDQGMFFKFLGGGSVTEYRPTRDGAPRYVVWRINLTM